MKLDYDTTTVMLIDVQGKLAQSMYEKERLFENMRRMLRAAEIMNIPCVWLEQVPSALGPTIQELRECLVNQTPIVKHTFSCCENDECMRRLENEGRKQVLLMGIETHICIWQTARDLTDAGYAVQVIADAVSSRVKENKEIALARMRDYGVNITSVEMALFEILGSSKNKLFKSVSALLK